MQWTPPRFWTQSPAHAHRPQALPQQLESTCCPSRSYPVSAPFEWMLGVATGATLKEIEQMIWEAIEFHLEELREDGLRISKPTTICQDIEV